jgi:hypothetical protein
MALNLHFLKNRFLKRQKCFTKLVKQYCATQWCGVGKRSKSRRVGFLLLKNPRRRMTAGMSFLF